MKKIYFTLICSGLAVILFAQKPVTLKWQIVDEKLDPISEVAVVKKGLPGGVIANQLGEFSIDVIPGKDTMIILCLGHEPLEVPISNDTPKKWIETLENKTFTLDEILVVGRVPEAIFICDFPVWGTMDEYHCELPFYEEVESLESINLLVSNKSFNTKIFPIPTSGSIFIGQKSPLGMVDLYNLNGQKLQSFNFGEQLNASIDLGAYSAGTYFLRSNHGWVEKVVLQK